MGKCSQRSVAPCAALTFPMPGENRITGRPLHVPFMAFLVPRFNCSDSEMVLWMIFCSKGSEEMSAINGLIESGFLPYEPCFQPIQENLWHEDGYRLQKRFYIKGHLFYPGCPCRALH